MSPQSQQPRALSYILYFLSLGFLHLLRLTPPDRERALLQISNALISSFFSTSSNGEENICTNFLNGSNIYEFYENFI